MDINTFKFASAITDPVKYIEKIDALTEKIKPHTDLETGWRYWTDDMGRIVRSYDPSDIYFYSPAACNYYRYFETGRGEEKCKVIIKHYGYRNIFQYNTKGKLEFILEF
jgi:hypothetical protein